MKRRDFLAGSAAFLGGAFLGLNGLSDAFAFEVEGGSSPDRSSRIALIIDDIGFSVPKARQFLDLGVPITFSILPRLQHSHALANEICKEGHEIMLHQPMEPYDRFLNPGPGALYVGDDGEKIARIMTENLAEVSHAYGVNNHMGSRFTSCPRETNDALGVLKGSGLFFVDSRTSGRSVVGQTARRLQIPAASRHIFLDHYLGEQAVLSALERLRIRALKQGSAIGIGHPFPETASGIGRFARILEDSNISLVYVSSLVPRTREDLSTDYMDG